MCAVKFGEPFGLDFTDIDESEFDLSLARISVDIKSDFIFAPHLNFIYRKAGSNIKNDLITSLKKGKFLPSAPMTIEVPKSGRIPIKSTPPRKGPNFSRPGSILMPLDRLFVQFLADRANSYIDSKIDHQRSFSHQTNYEEPEKMFLATRKCWNDLQEALRAHSREGDINYVLKVDIANFFGAINQHTLANVLADSGYPKAFVERLEVVLTSYTGNRSSRGIIQGMFPFDLLGNFYLAPIDRFLADESFRSARYVDDLYIFVKSVDEANSLVRKLLPELRNYDLSLNEAKSALLPKSALNSEEPDLESLFNNAIDEISDFLQENQIETEYGFQSDWDDEGESKDSNSQDEDSFDIELAATESLFLSIPTFTGHEENIERFCLPLFAKANSDFAVDHVLQHFRERPSMSQIYCAYLSRFISNDAVHQFLGNLLLDTQLFDWQRMWVLAALMSRNPNNDDFVKSALDVVKNGASHDALRAVAAIYVGWFGDATRRKSLVSIYSSVAPYIQSAIYFSSLRWQGAEKANARTSWGNQTGLNQYITIAATKI